jgi:antitoxin VapB
MPETRSVKLFKNGSSQAVRLPAEFRFDGDEVYATRDETTGDVVLSKSPGKKIWEDFFAMLQTVDVPKEFMAERPMNQIPSRTGVFDDLIEDVERQRRRA